MRLSVFFSLALLGSSLHGRQTQANDWLVVGGDRAGPISRNTTHADLIQLFGAANVADDQVEVSEGPQFGTIIYKNKPDELLIVLWNNDKSEDGISALIFCFSAAKNCRWHTAENITVGTTLRALEQMNRRPFTIAGFGFDGSGSVISWQDGALRMLESDCGAVRLRLGLDDPKLSKDQRRIEDQVTGDRKFSSGHPAMQALNPAVAYFNMDFSTCSSRRRSRLVGLQLSR